MGPLGKKFFPKKSRTAEQKLKGGPFGLAEKQEKPFWFSSLGQMVQFGAITFCRTFRNYFCQFVWIEKSHYNSRVSLHEAPTKKRVTDHDFPPPIMWAENNNLSVSIAILKRYSLLIEMYYRLTEKSGIFSRHFRRKTRQLEWLVFGAFSKKMYDFYSG